MAWDWELIDSTYLAAVRILVGCILLTAGLAKLFDIDPFKRTLQTIGFPYRFVSVAAAVPLFEIGIGLWLLSGLLIIPAASTALLLLCLFNVVLARLFFNGSTADCNCFGNLLQLRSLKASILRNLAFCALALLVLIAGDAGQYLTSEELVASAILASLPLTLALLANKAGWFLSIGTIPTAVKARSKAMEASGAMAMEAS